MAMPLHDESGEVLVTITLRHPNPLPASFMTQTQTLDLGRMTVELIQEAGK